MNGKTLSKAGYQRNGFGSMASGHFQMAVVPVRCYGIPSTGAGRVRKKKPKFIQCGEYLAEEIRSDRFRVSGPHRFMLHKVQMGKWEANGRNSAGRYRKQVPVYATDPAQAVLMAAEKLHGKQIGDPRDLELSEAFALWDSTLTIQDVTRKGYQDATERFLEYTDARGISLLGDLQRIHLEQYLAGLDGLDYDTKVNRWKPIRAMILWASAGYPNQIQDIRKGIKIRDTGPKYPDHRTPMLISQICDFLLFLRKQPFGWHTLPGVALQALVGLRESEVHRMLWSSVDLDHGTVTVQGLVKTDQSVRVIPVAGIVLDILTEVPRLGERILHTYQKPSGYSQAVERQMDRWGVLRIKVTDLRKTLETEAIMRGWSGYVFNRYLGRAPHKDDVQAQSYILVGTHLQDLFRDQVVARLDEVLAPFRSEWNTTSQKVVTLRKKGV